MDDQRALKYTCPSCFSKPGEKCTEATESSRKKVNYVHYMREERIED